MDFSKLIDNTIFGLTIIMAALPLFKDVVDRADTNKRFFSKITFGGWVVIIAALALISLNFYKGSLDEENRKSERLSIVAEDSVNFEEILNKNNLKINKKTKKITSIDSVYVFKKEQKEEPYIAITRGALFLPSQTKSGFDISIEFKNTGEGDAYNLVDKVVLMSQINNNLKIENELNEAASNKLIVIPKDSRQNISYGYRPVNRTLQDTQYLYFKLSYTDKHKIPQIPLRQVYFVSYPTNVNSLINIVKENELKRIKAFLIQQEKW